MEVVSRTPYFLNTNPVVNDRHWTKSNMAERSYPAFPACHLSHRAAPNEHALLDEVNAEHKVQGVYWPRHAPVAAWLCSSPPDVTFGEEMMPSSLHRWGWLNPSPNVSTCSDAGHHHAVTRWWKKVSTRETNLLKRWAGRNLCQRKLVEVKRTRTRC